MERRSEITNRIRMGALNMSEADEIAKTMSNFYGSTLDAARRYVRNRMPGESEQAIDNVAYSLWLDTQQLSAAERAIRYLRSGDA